MAKIPIQNYFNSFINKERLFQEKCILRGEFYHIT